MEYLAGILFITNIILIMALNTVRRWQLEAEARAAECEAKIEQVREGLG